MSGPLISELPLWERHEERVLAILRSALERLRSKRPEGNEPDLNREFFLCILEVNRENKESGDSWFDHAPVFEGRNPPTPDTHGSASERKIPDLYWGYIDHQEPDPRRSARNFVIECKRLGSPSHSGSSLNAKYVDDGVRRFVDIEWKYGKNVPTGAMIGYMESLTPEQILVDVNGCLETRYIPTLTLSSTLESSLSEMEHSFDRPFEISPFRLLHLWIDLHPLD